MMVAIAVIQLFVINNREAKNERNESLLVNRVNARVW